MGCEGMYRFIISCGMSGLSYVLKTSRYDDMLLWCGDFGYIFSKVYVFSRSWQGCLLSGVWMLKNVGFFIDL